MDETQSVSQCVQSLVSPSPTRVTRELQTAKHLSVGSILLFFPHLSVLLLMILLLLSIGVILSQIDLDMHIIMLSAQSQFKGARNENCSSEFLFPFLLSSFASSSSAPLWPSSRCTYQYLSFALVSFATLFFHSLCMFKPFFSGFFLPFFLQYYFCCAPVFALRQHIFSFLFITYARGGALITLLISSTHYRSPLLSSVPSVDASVSLL